LIEGQPSVTAERVAVRRAVHQLVDRPLIFEDPIALRILGPAREREIRSDLHRVAGGPLGRALRAHLVIRSRVAEDRLAEAVAQGVRQYVVLGAGLDTFACRNTVSDLRVFEVDHPATQAWKRQRLKDAALDVPSSATFVPCEFGGQSIAAALVEAGLDPARPAFFSWLGVTMYLEPATTLQTITDLAPLAARGGGLVFDYGIRIESAGLEQRLTFKALAHRLSTVGEPMVGFFDPASLVAAVRGAGFTRIEDLSAADLTVRFLLNRSDGLRLSGLGRILCART
jgi:methyltransferase (TIGR00027 family)